MRESTGSRRRFLQAAAGWGAALGAWRTLPPAAAQPAAPDRAGSVGTEERNLTLRDPRLRGAPLTRYWQVFVPRRGPNTGPLPDPKFNRQFPFRCMVNVWADPAAEKETRFRVHFGAPEDEPLARKVSHVLARVYWLGREYLGLTLPENEAFRNGLQVWLARDGRPGAEEFRKNVYLYAIGEDRPPAEWIREIAHEYAHVVLPPFGPFTAPERWANGYLGERLLIKWLIDNGHADAWGIPFSGAAYLANQIYPLRDRFLNAGPGARAGQQADASGMDHFIGFALALEATYGPALLREGLQRVRSTQPAALATGVADALKAGIFPELVVDPRAFIPGRSTVEVATDQGIRGRRAAYWIFLPSGVWRVGLQGARLRGVQLQLEGAATRPLPDAAGASFEARADVAAWRRAQFDAGSEGPFELGRIVLTRAPGS